MIRWHGEEILDGWWGYEEFGLGPLDDEEARQLAIEQEEDGAGVVNFASMAIVAIKEELLDDEF